MTWCWGNEVKTGTSTRSSSSGVAITPGMCAVSSGLCMSAEIVTVLVFINSFNAFGQYFADVDLVSRRFVLRREKIMNKVSGILFAFYKQI